MKLLSKLFDKRDSKREKERELERVKGEEREGRGGFWEVGTARMLKSNPSQVTNKAYIIMLSLVGSALM